MPATLVAPLVSGRSKHKETWCSLVFRVFRVFHVFHVFHVFPSSEPPKTIKRSTAVYSVQPTTAIGVLYNYNMTRKDGQKQAQELLCCGGTPTMLRKESEMRRSSRRCGYCARDTGRKSTYDISELNHWERYSTTCVFDVNTYLC